MKYKFIIIAIIIQTVVFALETTLYYHKHPDAINYNGMVVSSNEYASDVGVKVLKNGGNAIDAAIAVNFALSVVYPMAGNIGGGGFMVIRTADGVKTTIDFREKAPLLSSENMFLDDSLNATNKSLISGLSSGVPGTVAGMWYAHEKFGSKPWSELLKYSVNLAQYGFELDPFNLIYLNSSKYSKYLSIDSETKKIFTKVDPPFKIGEKFIQLDLANTLKRISYYGAREFYEGQTSQNIIKCMNRTGGIINSIDLKNYKPVERKPITFEYKDYKIYTMPPPSSGGVALAQILKQLENIDLSKISYHSADHIHYLSEIEKRVYADRSHYMGDPDFNTIPIENLISNNYAIDRWKTIDLNKATPSLDITYGNIYSSINNESMETTHFSVIDKWGNAVSVTTTLNRRYGNGIVVDDSGFLLNNQMDDFSIKPGHPNAWGLIGNEANSIEPNKRMLSSMTPTIVEYPNGELYLILGSPGGSTIITTIAQILSNIIDYKMNIQDAVDAYRFHHQWLPDLIDIEPYSLSDDTINKLKQKGHQLRVRGSIGEANCILIDYIYSQDDTTSVYYGASDSRRDASAKGY